VGRRRGALVDAVRAAGRDVEISLLALDVRSFNEEARAFLGRQGFAPYNERLWSRCASPGNSGTPKDKWIERLPCE